MDLLAPSSMFLCFFLTYVMIFFLCWSPPKPSAPWDCEIHYCFTCHLLYFPALEIVYFPIILASSRCVFLSLDSFNHFFLYSFILSHLLYVNILKVLNVFNILAHTFNPTAPESEADRFPGNSRSAGST